jgi:hypothetical protein
MAADRAHPSREGVGRVLAQLLYGYLLLDSGSHSNAFVVDTTPENGPELPVFTSNKELIAARGGQSSNAMVVPAPEVLKLVAQSNIASMIINPAGAPMRFQRESLVAAAQSPLNIRLRQSLALGDAERHAAVLDALNHPGADEPLIIALYPESVPADGDLTHAVPMTSTNSEGNKVMLVFTSYTEGMLATEARYAARSVADILRIASHPSIGGVLINPATSGEVVLRAKLTAMAGAD